MGNLHPGEQTGNKTKSYFIVDSARKEIKDSVATNRGRRNVQRKLYNEEEDEERGKHSKRVVLFTLCECVPSG